MAVRERLLSGERAVVQVLQGMGGLGKTQLAAEYAHRFAASYDSVWWITAEQPGFISDQIAELAIELGAVSAGTDTTMAVRTVMAELRGRSGWLLIFDNAQIPNHVTPWLPGGANGHVLITSRMGGWGEIASRIEVGIFTRNESVAMLCGRVPGLGEADALRLAEELGDLPLTVARAAMYLAENSEPASDYQAALSALENITKQGWYVREGKLVVGGPTRATTAAPVERPDAAISKAFLLDKLNERAQADIQSNPLTDAASRKAVLVIYGHDQEANKAIFDWLRAIGLQPREWGQLIEDSGSASPYIGQILERAFRSAQAIIALFTPDEFVIGRAESNKEDAWRLQSRPNVLIEAGMALITHPQRTVLVMLGNMDLPSDLAGRHYIKLDGTPGRLNELANRLEGAGCELDRTGADWLDPSRFPDRTIIYPNPSAD